MARKQYQKQYVIFFTTIFCLFLSYTYLPMVFSHSPKTSTKIYDKNGTLLLEIIPQNGIRDEINTEKLPKYLTDLLLLSEDKNFYGHLGVDFGAIARAATSGSGGASTLTMQLMKMKYYADDDRTILQKARESLAALTYSLFISKDETLKEYLERAYFGNEYYGIGNASRGYFGKPPENLSLKESAYLVALIPNPRASRLYESNGELMSRANALLQKAIDAHKITKEMLEKEQNYTPLPQEKKTPKLAPHFVDYVLSEVKKTYPDVEDGGYEIKTTLDLPSNETAEKLIIKHVSYLNSKHVTNGALIMIEPNTGAVQAMVGSKNYFADDIPGMFNVTTAQRQPGSSLKPFTYLTAFLQGNAPATIIYDIPSSFKTATGDTYNPKNYDLKSHGPVSMRTALASSLNIPAVKVLDMIGFDAFYKTLKSFGITFENTPEYYGLGITLGGGEVTLLGLAHAYSELANGGIKTESYAIDSITKDGKILFQHEAPQNIPVLDAKYIKEAIAMITDVLKDPSARSLSFGLASSLNISPEVAVKTGTTKDFRDNWAFGYTKDIAVGVWVGNNDNTPMEGVSGISGAIPILHDFLKSKQKVIYEKSVPLPSTLVFKTVCMISGKLATPECSGKRQEMFIPGTEPKENDTWYVTKVLDKKTNKLANDSCKDDTYTKVFLSVPSELFAWARDVRMDPVPSTYCDGTMEATKSAYISSPENNAIFLMKPDLPSEVQKIPVRIEGNGKFTSELFVDGKKFDDITMLPYTTLLDLPLGKHTVSVSDQTRSFEIRQK